MARKTVTIRITDVDEWEKFLDKLEQIHNTPRGKGHVGPTLEKFAYDYANDNISNITQKEYDQLNNDFKEQASKIVKLQEQLQQTTNNEHEKIMELKDKISQLNKKLVNYENVSEKSDEDAKRINILEKEKNEFKHDNELKDQTIEKLSQDNHDLKLENNQLSNKNNDLTNELNSITMKYDANEEIIKTNKTTIAQLTEQNSNLTKTTARLEDENSKQKQEIVTVRNEQKHFSIRNEKLQDEVNTLQNESKKYTYIVGQIKKMSFIDRILKRYPKEVKELNPYTENDEETPYILDDSK
ncbi:hypothetical protein [Methanosphaera sp. WGK6]|uniref:hypothetical protein n=1 Tax=Methanosphaera sp. WGK6 TaxID=1561964 RepID=UPI00084CB5F2|nr:hypothetical protein [Methanosphaera sp. WGK6]OED30324.1 hypothetical protein NL43_02795 [Methanosphaera sp. WGK6]